MKNIQDVLTIAKCLYDIMSFLQAYKLQILQTYYQPNIVLLGFGQICDVMQEKKHTSKNVLRCTFIFLKTRGQLD